MILELWRGHDQMKAPKKKPGSSLIANLQKKNTILIYQLRFIPESKKTKPMKKHFSLFLFAFMIAATFTSCKKSSTSENSGDYHLNANIDGKAKSFNTTAMALKSDLGNGIYSLVITGMTSNEQLALSLWSDKDDFTAGKTFSLNALGGTTYNILAYAAPLGSSDPMSQWTSTYDNGIVPESFQCTITEATSTYIKGTFSGVIYQNNAVVASKTVTEGQFYAKF